MPSKSVIHSQRLHRDVVDAEVVTTLERRKREGNDSLQLTVALQVNGTILTNFVFEAIHPFDFTVVETAVPLLTLHPHYVRRKNHTNMSLRIYSSPLFTEMRGRPEAIFSSSVMMFVVRTRTFHRGQGAIQVWHS